MVNKMVTGHNVPSHLRHITRESKADHFVTIVEFLVKHDKVTGAIFMIFMIIVCYFAGIQHNDNTPFMGGF